MLKKIIIGLFAGTVTGLFGSGGRYDTCSSFYIYFKIRRKRGEGNINILYTPNGMCKLNFLF